MIFSKTPDAYFSATQQQQLAQLMHSWRKQRDQGKALPAHELTGARSAR